MSPACSRPRMISAVRRPKARLAVTEGESVLREWQQPLIEFRPHEIACVYRIPGSRTA